MYMNALSRKENEKPGEGCAKYEGER
jgi:hypothetical protein